MGNKKIIVAAKGAILREGLITILQHRPDIQVLACCNNGFNTVETATKLKPDIVILDDDIAECDYISTSERINQAKLESRIIVLTNGLETGSILSILTKTGAKAFIIKDVDMERLLEVIDSVYKGCLMLSPSIAAKLATELDSLKANVTIVRPEKNFDLTKRQIEVLKLVVKGLTNREIAQTLFISENTAKAHVRGLLEKMDAENRQQAISLAMENNLISETFPKA